MCAMEFGESNEVAVLHANDAAPATCGAWRSIVNLKKMSTAGILKMYGAIREALEVDDNSPHDRKPYGVREFSDWREWAVMFESELDGRPDVKYEKIRW